MNLRRVRGTVGTILVWGLAGATLGIVLESIATIIRFTEGRSGPLLAVEPFQQAAAVWSTIGAAMGLGFALALWGATRGRATLAALSIRRVVTCGALAGVATALGLLGIITGGTLPPALAVGVYLVLGATMGIGAATGSVAIARGRNTSLRKATAPLRAVPPAT